MLIFRSASLLFVLGATALQAVAQGLPTVAPEEVGLSPSRLGRLEAVMQDYVDRGEISGLVTLIARGGRVAHFKAFGQADSESGVPMPTDAIFRIASQTKALTSVAIMMLVEEGLLVLSDPVSKYIPAYQNTTVIDSRSGEVVPANRQITIRDLLTHTSGISYGTGPAQQQYLDAGVHMWYFADKDEPIGASVERLASLPFDAQPGGRWVYGFSADVLGHVVERVSGMSLADFFRRRITEPLGMTDTHFYLPAVKSDRLAAVYSRSDGGVLERAPAEGNVGQGAYVDGPRSSFSGGAGLLSTAGDYARFLQMLLNGGELDGVRLLSPKTVQLMTSNHVGDLYRGGAQGFGLGFWIVEHVGRSGDYGSVGAFGWGGAYFSTYWVDPQENLVAVFMAQLIPSGGSDLQTKFRALVYQAIVGGPR